MSEKMQFLSESRCMRNQSKHQTLYIIQINFRYQTLGLFLKDFGCGHFEWAKFKFNVEIHVRTLLDPFRNDFYLSLRARLVDCFESYGCKVWTISRNESSLFV